MPLVRRIARRLLPTRVGRHLRLTFISAKFHLHTHLGRYPGILFPLYRLLGVYQDRVATPACQLVIEGFPRSASTFCVYAFQVAQRRAVPVASHIHLPASVIRGVRLGIPVLVLIRRPRDAVASAFIREPYSSVRAHLLRYLDFYRTLEPYRQRVVVVDFDQAVNDFGGVMERINQKFGTGFQLFHHTEAEMEEVNSLLDARHQQFGGNALTSYRPQPQKEIVKRQVDFKGKEVLLEMCEELYREWSPVIAGMDTQDHSPNREPG